MNVGINLIKYPQFFVIRIPKMCKFRIYKNIEILCDYTMHDTKRNLTFQVSPCTIDCTFMIEMKNYIRKLK